MLSIHAMSMASEEYYTTLAKEDYYLQGGEPPGRWFGSGAKKLGLSGKVKPKDFKALFRGFSPKGKKLVQNAGKRTGKRRRKPGWDHTFSAPKSVSTIWSQATAADRQEIQKAHDEAVRKAIEYLEQEVAKSRTGRDGYEKTSVDLVVALFEHGTSRALDPQLHTHATVINVGVRPDGSTGSLFSHDFYDHKMVAGAIYRCELGYQLVRRFGFPLEPGKKATFEVRGVIKSLMDFFSKRRKDIEEELADVGIETASAAAIATLKTRPVKDLVPPRQSLFATWREEGVKHWFTRQAVDFLKGRQRLPKSHYKDFREAFDEAIAVLTAEHSTFTKSDLLRRTAEAAQHRGIPVDYLRAAVDRRLKSPSIINLGIRNDEQRYTTLEILELENDIIDNAERLLARETRPLRDTSVAKAITKKRKFKGAKDTLSVEQAQALAYLAQGEGALKCLTGFAGTGKTTLLRALREICDRDGVNVVAACVTGKAARELQEATGIPSDTLAMRLMQLYPTTWQRLKHSTRQWYRAIRKWKTSPPDTLCLGENTIFILDEAPMAPTRETKLLMDAVVEGGGQLCPVGDDDQLQAIALGGAISAIIRRYGSCDLKNITRQKDEWARETVKQMSRGEAENVLRTYAEKGCLHVLETDEEREDSLIDHWVRQGGIKNPQKNIICAPTNCQIDRFNDLAQQQRARAGELNLSAPIKIGDETFYPGDIVRFTKKSRRLGVENGDIGVIEAVKPYLSATQEIAVRIEGKKKPVRIPVKSRLGPLAKPLHEGVRVGPVRILAPVAAPIYQGLRRGYAHTTHALQGSTVENAYVALGGSMTDREMSYVQMSRARNTTRLYALKDEAGMRLSQLAQGGQVQTETKKVQTLYPLDEKTRAKMERSKPLDSPLADKMAKSRKKKLAIDIGPEYWSLDLDRALEDLKKERDMEDELQQVRKDLEQGSDIEQPTAELQEQERQEAEQHAAEKRWTDELDRALDQLDDKQPIRPTRRPTPPTEIER